MDHPLRTADDGAVDLHGGESDGDRLLPLERSFRRIGEGRLRKVLEPFFVRFGDQAGDSQRPPCAPQHGCDFPAEPVACGVIDRVPEFMDDIVVVGPPAGRVEPDRAVVQIVLERLSSVGHPGQVQRQPRAPGAPIEGLGVDPGIRQEIDAQFANIAHVRDQIRGMPVSGELVVQRLENLSHRIDGDAGMVESGDDEVGVAEIELLDRAGFGLCVSAQSADVCGLLRGVRRMSFGAPELGHRLRVQVEQHVFLCAREVRQPILEVGNLFPHRGDLGARDAVALPHPAAVDIPDEFRGEWARHGLLGIESGPPAGHLAVRADIPMRCAAPSPGDRVQQTEQLA
ncbi:hypothetical protein B7C42_08132 [Nocardia cerradoensis]|uniref:Uncharacterized protein n=1 Tax=Nocardia cerradoensis TaxID=85688 RepID=A0A231GT86_9NOCA|nr:hypothetical protein B7C42_08132 [Nocardia cerradoensis]